MPSSNSNIEQLKQAIQLAEQISGLQSRLDAILSSLGSAPSLREAKTAAEPKRRGRKKGQMSAAGRARIVAAQKARWAKIKAAKSALSGISSNKSPSKNGRRRKRR
jgi:hypothetical protein